MNLLASDFDNTLWFQDHMNKKDVEAIQSFQKKGHLFGGMYWKKFEWYFTSFKTL